MLWIDLGDVLLSVDAIKQDGCKLLFCRVGGEGSQQLTTLVCETREKAESEMERIRGELAKALEKGKTGTVVII